MKRWRGAVNPYGTAACGAPCDRWRAGGCTCRSGCPLLLEGESLLNDATGLVLFRFAVAAAVTGTLSAMDALGSFALLTLGAAVRRLELARVLTLVW